MTFIDLGFSVVKKNQVNFLALLTEFRSEQLMLWPVVRRPLSVSAFFLIFLFFFFHGNNLDFVVFKGHYYTCQF